MGDLTNGITGGEAQAFIAAHLDDSGIRKARIMQGRQLIGQLSRHGATVERTGKGLTLGGDGGHEVPAALVNDLRRYLPAVTLAAADLASRGRPCQGSQADAAAVALGDQNSGLSQADWIGLATGISQPAGSIRVSGSATLALAWSCMRTNAYGPVAGRHAGNAGLGLSARTSAGFGVWCPFSWLLIRMYLRLHLVRTDSRV